jgi:subtilisin family serine protease
LKVRGGAAGVLASIEQLRARSGVRFAEPDYLMHEDAVPNDPLFGVQWGSSNVGQFAAGDRGLHGADDRALAAWRLTTGSRSVVIGEADSGVDYQHPDLAANVWSNPGGIGSCGRGTHGYNVLDGTCDPMDDERPFHGHGTHVAGILAAVGDNSLGVTGMNWSASVLPVKWLDASGDGSTSGLISALDWLLKAKEAGVNVRVVNDSATYAGTARSQALVDEIDALGAHDILFVTAAGNTGEDNDDPAYRRYPCAYDRPNELCVTASDQRDRLPSWANYGASTVDLAAPGENVYSTLRGGEYGYVSGGSMASPQVAGAAALILSRRYLSPPSLKSDILRNVDLRSAFAGRVRTGGRLNVCAALPGCASARLMIGRLGGSAKQTRNRRLRVRVLSNRRGLHSVVVTVREGTSRGPVLGRSRPFSVSSNRVVVVRLRRALGGGSYVAVATGRDRDDHSLRAAGRFRLRG